MIVEKLSVRQLCWKLIKPLYFIIKLINDFFPKRNNLVVFHSLPSFSGNVKPVALMIAKKTGVKCVVLVSDRSQVRNIFHKYREVTVVGLYSFKGIWSIIRAKVIVSTHALLPQVKGKNQKYIELWHGTPIKRMQTQQYFKFIDYFVVTSEFSYELINKSFQLDRAKYKILGSPITDYYFDNKASRKCLESLVGQKLRGRKVVFYLPTFREGFKSCEGTSLIESNIFRFDEFDRELFEAFLKKNNVIMIVKLHPFESHLFRDFLKSSDNLIFLNQELLDFNVIDLNEFVGTLDLLITDYSSVFIDLLVTQKPVLFSCPDIKEYSQSRGLVFNSLEAELPGPIVTTQNGLQSEIVRLLQDNCYFMHRRNQLLAQAHSHQDRDSTLRCVEFILEQL